MSESFRKGLPYIAIALTIMLLLQYFFNMRVENKGEAERVRLQSVITSIEIQVNVERKRRKSLEEVRDSLTAENTRLSALPPKIKVKYVEKLVNYNGMTELGKDSLFATRLSQASRP
jgi:hypothetical protein